MILSKETCERLVKLEQDGLRHVRESQWESAATCFEEIVSIFPSWEHGAPYSSLGCCYEDMGDVKKAELNYLRAISYDPGDVRHWGNLASFLYMTQQWERSYQAYLILIGIKSRNALPRINETRVALYALAKMTDRSKADVDHDIEVRTNGA